MPCRWRDAAKSQSQAEKAVIPAQAEIQFAGNI
jgi:hypothetical protein